LSALAKSRPGQIIYASSGIGTGSHLSGELFKMMTHTDLLHVPYKGSAQAANDLAGGHVPVMFATMSTVYLHTMSGRMRPIAITSAKRSPAAPKVPTVAESGVPGYETVQWIAMSAPRATPKAVIDRLNAELAAGVKSPELRERLSSQGYDPEVCTPQQLADYIKVEFARFGKLIRAINLKDE
jgi:tripartite-type tricarboxylate transporter receptor subunit TctC